MKREIILAGIMATSGLPYSNEVMAQVKENFLASAKAEFATLRSGEVVVVDQESGAQLSLEIGLMRFTHKEWEVATLKPELEMTLRFVNAQGETETKLGIDEEWPFIVKVVSREKYGVNDEFERIEGIGFSCSSSRECDLNGFEVHLIKKKGQITEVYVDDSVLHLSYLGQDLKLLRGKQLQASSVK